MGAYVVRRLSSGLLLVFLLTFLAYAVYQLIPVDPACLRIDCGPGNHSTPEDFANADRQLGVDRPLPYQYARFVWRFVRHGSFGTSWIGGLPIDHMIGETLPVTAWIVAGGLVVLLLLALPLGCYAALRPRSPADRGLLAFGILGLAVHPFVLAIAIKELFGTVHVGGDGYCGLLNSDPGCGGVGAWANHLVLPWVCFALFFLPLYLRMIRVRMIETLSEPWVVTARAKGASEVRVVGKHVLRNAVGPLLPMVAADAGTALTAAIYIEVVFHINGIGQLAVRALSGQGGGYDRPVVVAIVAIVGMSVVALNVISDIGRAAIDPRVRLRTSGGMLRMPRVVARSPFARVPKRVYSAVALAGVVALGFVVYTWPNPPSGIVLTQPLRTQRLGFTQTFPLTVDTTTVASVKNGALVVHLDRAVFGKSGWKVDFWIRNDSTVPVTSVPAARSFRGAAFSLGYNYRDGDFVAHRELNASEFIPGPPGVIAPGKTFHGTFGGLEDVPHGVQYGVTFGEFAPLKTPTLMTYISTETSTAP